MSNPQRNLTATGTGATKQPTIFRIGANKAKLEPTGGLGISRSRKLFLAISLATSVVSFTIYGVRAHMQTQAEKANLIDSFSMSLASQNRISGLGYEDVKLAVDAMYDFDLSHQDVFTLLEMKRKLADQPYFFKSKPTIEMILETLRLNTEWISRPGREVDYDSWFGMRADGYRASGSEGEANRIERIRSILMEFNNHASVEFKNKIIDNATTDRD